MGRRKIEIKAIKDDRNRSVTFLKRKGGLFKKAHELSVLCSVDVAVIIFGNNKKLYEYSSTDIQDLLNRHHYFGGANEHKGPGDYNGGNDDDDDDEGLSPRGSMEPQMMPPQYQGANQFPLRHQTDSQSPPMPNGASFQQQQHPGRRSHTPQPQYGSRPGSRNDMRRVPSMVPQPAGPPTGPQQQVNGYAYIPNPAIYNPHSQPNLPHSGLPIPGPPYPYAQSHGPQGSPPPPPPPPHHQPQQQPPHQQHQQLQPPPPMLAAHSHPQMNPYMDEQRRPLLPPNFPTGPQGTPLSRAEPSPQQHPAALPIPITHISPPTPLPPPQMDHDQHQPLLPHNQQQQQQHSLPPHGQQSSQNENPPPPPPTRLEPPKRENTAERPQPPLLNTDTAIKKLPQRKQHSIFTPIDENRSILSQHLASFASEPERHKPETNRSQSIDVGAVSRNNSSPPLPQRANTQASLQARKISASSIPDTKFTPPSRSNSLNISGPSLGGGSRPRLKVQIPDEGGSENGSATAESNSPRNPTDATSQPRRPASDSHAGSMVLPPPSPSASALLSAGASGPPNPFARPAPHQNNNMNIDTPVSALPSRFLNNEFLPSPSSFYPDWNFRSSDSNTLPSPLNFATPIVGTGPSFLRDDAAVASKRKSPESNGGPSESAEASPEAKRAKVE